MADKKGKGSKKKTSSKKVAPAPDMETNVDESKVNETPEKKEGDKPRVWYVEPKEAMSLRTSRGTLIKGRLRPVTDGSPDYEFFKGRSDVNLTSKV